MTPASVRTDARALASAVALAATRNRDARRDALPRRDGSRATDARAGARSAGSAAAGHVRFGGVEKYKEAGRDARGRQWLDAISLDTRLGVRMLVKYRGLTLVGGFAMAVAIAIGATAFEAFGEMLDPALPLDDGERIVSVQYASADPGSRERAVLHEFVGVARRAEIDRASRRLPHGAAQSGVRTHAARAGQGCRDHARPDSKWHGLRRLPAGICCRATSATARLRCSSIGYQAWQSTFGGDRDIVGRVVHLGGVARTVVGVMPDGFRFPYDHQYWIPLRANPLAYEPLRRAVGLHLRPAGPRRLDGASAGGAHDDQPTAGAQPLRTPGAAARRGCSLHSRSRRSHATRK